VSRRDAIRWNIRRRSRVRQDPLMISLYVCIGRQRSKRFEIAKERVTIGSDASCDIVLRDGGVPSFHGALVRVRERWFLFSRGADASTPDRMRALDDGARLEVGAYTIVLAAAAPAKPRRARAGGTPAQPLPVAPREQPRGTSPPPPAADALQPLAPVGPTVPYPAVRPDPVEQEVARDPDPSGAWWSESF